MVLVGVPLTVLVLPNVVPGRDAWDAFVVAVVVCMAAIVATLALALVALGRASREDRGGKILAIVGLVAAVVAPFVGGVAAFFGLIVAAGGGAHGRPLRRRGVPVLPPIAGAPRPSSAHHEATERAWSVDDEVAASVVVLGLAPGARDALAQRWLEDARAEHASVATFARLTLDLLAVGAPPALVARASEAAADEVHHARIAYAIAARYAGQGVEPLPFVEAAAPMPRESADDRLERLARESLVEGVVGEGACVVALSRAAESAADPAIGRHLQRLAEDEARHASLAADVVRFAVARAPRALASLEDLLAAPVAVAAPAPAPDLLSHGVFGPADLRAAENESREVARALVAALAAETLAARRAA